MKTRTFAERVARRWTIVTILSIVGFLVDLILTMVILSFTVLILIPMTDAQQKVIFAITLINTTFAYLAGWTFRSLYITNIDTVIKAMGLLQKKTLKAALEEDITREEAEEEDEK